MNKKNHSKSQLEYWKERFQMMKFYALHPRIEYYQELIDISHKIDSAKQKLHHPQRRMS